VAALLSALGWLGGLQVAAAGVNVWTSNGPEAATSWDVAVDPRTPTTLYASLGYQGVFKSIDGGSRWLPVSAGLNPQLSFQTLAIDPQTPGIVYAVALGGIFKSTNGGGQWHAAQPDLIFSQNYITAMVMDPRTPTTLYAGTWGRGVFKSTDGGGTWSALDGGLANAVVRTLAIDPQTPTTLYASIAGNAERVFKTTDGGACWSATTSSPGGMIVSLAVDPHAPSTVYASNNCGVFKSTDAGGTWSGINTAGHCVGNLRFDPRTPATLYARYNSAAYSPVHPTGVLKTTDEGATWSALGPKSGEVLALAIDPETPTTLYAGLREDGVFKSTDGGGSWVAVNSGMPRLAAGDMVIDPRAPTTIYVGTERSGAFKSTDGGGSWQRLGPSLPREVRSLVIDPQTPGTLYAGAQGEGSNRGFYKSTDGGDTWHRASTGIPGTPVVDSVGSLVIDPQTPTTLYASATFNDVPGLEAGVFKTTDGGDNWVLVNSGLPAGSSVWILRFGLYLDPRTPTTLYARATEGPCVGSFRSLDAAASWNRYDFPGYCVSAMAFDPRTPTTLYASSAYDDGGLYKSTDGGVTWFANGAGLPPNCRVTDVAIDPVTTTTLDASGCGVSKSTDGGATWSAFSEGLPSATRVSVSALSIDPLNPSTVYAATPSGVYVIQQETPRQNRAPIADAGGDLAVECAGPAGTEVTLDAAGSSDPDGDDLSYRWTGPFGTIDGPRPTVTLPLGVSTITLVVSDGQSESVPDVIVVEVRDTLSPTLEVAATPAVLWPPDGRMVEVGFRVAASDRCDPAPAIILLDVRSSEPEGAGRGGASIVGADSGTDDRSIYLKADRNSKGPGRTYAITYRATDASGNAATAAAVVRIPHDQQR